jgi:hypothetical protein
MSLSTGFADRGRALGDWGRGAATKKLHYFFLLEPKQHKK